MILYKFPLRAKALVLLMLSCTMAACAPARWSELSFGGDNPPANQTNNPVDPTKPVVIETYETEARIGHNHNFPLDIVWVIDNSSSMTEEAAHVRTNFQSFIETVENHSNLKVALISRQGETGTNVTLPTAPDRSDRRQINRYVWSTDSLEITASAICPTNAKADSTCARVRVNARTDLSKIGASLRGFLRPASKKAFVFVTDDDSRISAQSFLNSFEESYPGQAPVIYGFNGLGASLSPCAAKTGAIYKALSTATAGIVSNICEPRWEESFKTLANNVVRWTSTPVPVPSNLTNASQIRLVECNGVKLEPSQYTLTPQGMLFDPGATEELNDEMPSHIRIQYEVPTLQAQGI